MYELTTSLKACLLAGLFPFGIYLLQQIIPRPVFAVTIALALAAGLSLFLGSRTLFIGSLFTMFFCSEVFRRFVVTKRLASSNFSEWQGKGWSNKNIIIPVYSESVGDYSKEYDYVDRIFQEMLLNLQRPYRVIREKGSSVMLSPILYTPPSPGISDYPAKGSINK